MGTNLTVAALCFYACEELWHRGSRTAAGMFGVLGLFSAISGALGFALEVLR